MEALYTCQRNSPDYCALKRGPDLFRQSNYEGLDFEPESRIWLEPSLFLRVLHLQQRLERVGSREDGRVRQELCITMRWTIGVRSVRTCIFYLTTSGYD